jgi:hypothetical protein
MKNQVWNIIFTAIVAAFLGCLGYLLTSISDLQKREASRTALEFTSKDATILQQKLTDVMTDIDLRISLIERDIQWVKILNGSVPKVPVDEAPADWTPPDPPVPPAPDALPNIQSRKYDFRQQAP